MLPADEILAARSWLTTPNVDCILSPDSDGFICGLMMTTLLNWRVVGFYDGKVLARTSTIRPSDCVFLDIEVNRPVRGSIGHHMLSFNNRLKPLPNFTFPQCIQPNELRAFDGRNDFQKKYPFGTCHLLISLLNHAKVLHSLAHTSTVPLLFTDGVWNNVFGYTENCLDWLSWLGIGEIGHPLERMFKHQTSIFEVMNGLDEFLRRRDGFNATGLFQGSTFAVGGRNRRTGDKLRISDSAGNPINLEKVGSVFKVHDAERDRIEGFIAMVGDLLGWKYDAAKWEWGGFDVQSFAKGSISPVTNANYRTLFEQNPLSLAMTSGNEIEYTLDTNNVF